MLIFFDSEFTGLAAEPGLVSMGLIAEDGRTFYGELTDTYRAEDCSDFVVSNVLPNLEGGGAAMTQQEIQERLKSWIESFNEPVQVAVDSLMWDWRWILWALKGTNATNGSSGTDKCWPKNLMDSPALLTMNYLANFDRFESELDSAFNNGFEGRRLRRHHALDDAIANRIAFQKSGGFA